jgi:hypothetical protein
VKCGLVIVWDIATGQQVWKYGQSTPIVAITFSPDGRFLAA